VHANKIAMPGDMARIMNQYCLMPSISAAAAFFTAAQRRRLPIGQVADSAGIEFGEKLVFIIALCSF
jgi:hypothetical protein